MGTQATLRQAADITLFSTARGSLATSSLYTASALHLLLLSQWHREPALLPPAFTSSWLPLTQPGHWAPLPASPGHKVRFPTAFLDACVFIAHCGELIWVGKSSKCSVLQAGALRKVKDGKVAPWWWWWGRGALLRCLAAGPPKGGARRRWLSQVTSQPRLGGSAPPPKLWGEFSFCGGVRNWPSALYGGVG